MVDKMFLGFNGKLVRDFCMGLGICVFNDDIWWNDVDVEMIVFGFIC